MPKHSKTMTTTHRRKRTTRVAKNVRPTISKRTTRRAESPKKISSPRTKKVSKRNAIESNDSTENVSEPKEVSLSCIVLPNRHENRRVRKLESLKRKKEKESRASGENRDDVDEENDSSSSSSSRLSNANRSRGQIVRYDNEKYKKLVNVFNGKSGEGFCYKFGVIRKGGKPFMNKLRDVSHAFLLELVYKAVQLCATKNRSIVSSEMICCVAQTYGITPVF